MLWAVGGLGLLALVEAGLLWSASKDTTPEQALLNQPHELYYDASNPCGPLSVAVASRLVGRDATLEQANAAVPTDAFGQSSMKELIVGLERLGLSAIPVKLSITHLEDLSTPLILHLHDNHFAAGLSLRNGRVLLIDPPNPLTVYDDHELSKFWKGNALIICDSRQRFDELQQRLALGTLRED